MERVELWNGTKPELIKSDTAKNKVTLTFLLRDNDGQALFNVKLKLYGVKNSNETLRAVGLVSRAIESIDLTRDYEVRLCDKHGNLLQAIVCDKYVYFQKRLRTE